MVGWSKKNNEEALMTKLKHTSRTTMKINLEILDTLRVATLSFLMSDVLCQMSEVTAKFKART